jgi:hypothetical protein
MGCRSGRLSLPVPRFTPFMLAALVSGSVACLAPRQSAPQPAMALAPAGLDARATYLLERCDAALRASAAPSTDMRVDALSALSQQRLVLVTELETNRAQGTDIEQRVLRARKGLRALAQSERERVLVAEALIDLDEGREIARPLPNRFSNHEDLRDLVDAHSMLRQNRDGRLKIEAQLTALDSTFALLATRSPTGVSQPSAPQQSAIPQQSGVRSGRLINPAL